MKDTKNVVTELKRLSSLRLDLQLPVPCVFATASAIKAAMNHRNCPYGAYLVLQDSLKLITQQIEKVSPELAEEIKSEFSGDNT